MWGLMDLPLRSLQQVDKQTHFNIRTRSKQNFWLKGRFTHILWNSVSLQISMNTLLLHHCESVCFMLSDPKPKLTHLQWIEWKQKSQRGICKKRINTIKSACLGSGLVCECLLVLSRMTWTQVRFQMTRLQHQMTLHITWTLSSIDLIYSCLDQLVWT